mmetsp:Transcript_3739/g.9787  ORF Transcript_3739/g.9787 Transcript_3739/m.9787 type:complete len:768 (-) Transcript_3739:404-2707(-)
MHVREKQRLDFENEFAHDDVRRNDEGTLGIGNANDIRDNRNSSDALALYVFGMNDENSFDKQTNNGINLNSSNPNIDGDSRLRNKTDYDEYGDKDGGKDSHDAFDPIPLPRLMTSFPPRSSSADSSSTNSSISINGTNHLHDYYFSQQPSPQRRDSSSASVGIVSVDSQTVQSNNYDSVPSPLLSSVTTRRPTSSRDSSANGATSPNPLDMEISPTPMNPYHNHRTRQEGIDINSDPKSVDELMAGALNSLSFKERESINHEIHGVDVRNAGVTESPELLRKSFHQLDLELQKLRKQWVSFDRSQRLFGTTTYLNTDDLRIMFLRCDFFDIKNAASRICKYAELMHEIFGEFALQRRPYLTDLTELELSILETGGYQVLPGRDRAGRRILGNFAFDAPEEFDVRSRLRLSLYCVLAFIEDVETQQKGAVTMSWWHNVSVDDFLIRKKVHERVDAIPMRMGAYHLCIPSENKSGRVGKKAKAGSGGEGVSSGIAHLIKTMAVISIGSELRPHLRFHTGSVLECFYALQSFGIHSDQIPVNTSSGKLKTKQHLKWMELRRLKEESLKNDEHKFDRIIECPKQNDVLFGRGRPIMRHPGNAVFRSIIQHKLEEYASAKSKKQTTDVTWEVVRTLKGKFGARFLKEENIENNGLGWIEVSNEIARQKVRIAFRDLRTKITKSNAAENGEKSKENYVKKNCTKSGVGKVKRKGEASSNFTTSHIETSSPITSFGSSLQQINSLHAPRESDSSTSVFLGMDGTDVKRQRLCFY